ncbi:MULTISPECIES: trypsin-like serine peptidase [unclassified Mameliella]|uniref:trypsin-like serine peptidase n=1 Tax=unclassified Mameliella TaxID=2630630 RepID=UPI0035320466
MRLFLVFFLWVLGNAASAQGLFSMESAEDGRGWEAVGRIEIAGSAFCTGALIAPHLVLTAAHCLYDPDTGNRVSVEDMQFLAGWRNGRAAAYRLVRKAVPHPDFVYGAQASTDRVRHDLALIELQHPIRNTTISPFSVGPGPSRGEEVGVVSYARDRSEAPSLQETCEVLARQDGMLVLSCVVDFGASGSPVFRLQDGVTQIVSVVSSKAQANGRPVALASGLGAPLDALKTALAADRNPGAGVDRLAAGDRRETGARFIRP